MDTPFLYELIGYAASLLVAVSLMMSRIVKLRIVNMIGAITFTLYGLLIDSMPVAAMNAFIVVVNGYHLVNIRRNKTRFDLLRVESGNPVLMKFLDYYQDDIRNQQPAFQFGEAYPFNLLLLNEMVPIGAMAGSVQDEVLFMDLDYVIPSHRDFKESEFLYKDEKEYFLDEGITEIRAKTGDDDHNRYLIKMGFSKPDGENDPVLILAPDS
jgi:hypothetical protein